MASRDGAPPNRRRAFTGLASLSGVPNAAPDPFDAEARPIFKDDPDANEPKAELRDIRPKFSASEQAHPPLI